MTAPLVKTFGQVNTSRGAARVQVVAGSELVTVSTLGGVLSVSAEPQEAVQLAQLLLDAARYALAGEGAAS